MQYISDSLGNSYNNNSPTPGAAKSDVGVEGFMDFDTEGKDYSKITGNFGGQLAHNVYPRTCSARRYDEYSETVMKSS